MIRYQVQKSTVFEGWKVVRIRGLERKTVSILPGHALALEAALEMAGLAEPKKNPLALLVTVAPR